MQEVRDQCGLIPSCNDSNSCAHGFLPEFNYISLSNEEVKLSYKGHTGSPIFDSLIKSINKSVENSVDVV